MSAFRHILTIVSVGIFLFGLYKTIFGFDSEKIPGGFLLLAGAILIVGLLITESMTEKRDKSE